MTTANVLSIESGRPFRDRIKALLAAFRVRSSEKRNIAKLQNLDDWILKDMGLTREEALRVRPRTLKEIGF